MQRRRYRGAGATKSGPCLGVREYLSELVRKDYVYMKPGIEELAWGMVMNVIDPFSNRIRFREPPSKLI